MNFVLQFLLLVSINAADLVYTGNTQSYLEPCGCVQGMQGGVARRSKAYPQDSEFVVFDSGNFTDIKDDLDRLRNQYYARAMQKLGTVAVGVGEAEASQPASYLTTLPVTNLLVATNLKTAAGAALLKPAIESSGYTFVSLLSQDFKPHPDFQVTDPKTAVTGLELKGQVVLLSSLNAKELETVLAAMPNKPVLVVANKARGDFETVAGVPVSYPGDKGKYVRIFSAGKVKAVPVEEDFSVDPELQLLIQDYYDAILKDPSLQKTAKRHFEKDPQEMRVLAGKNKFIGSETCKECHQAEYAQYMTTKHSQAFNILQEKKRDHVPDCVSCHSVGLGYESGYEIGLRQKYLKHVGCESCHGAGLEHYKAPRKDNISKAVSEARCNSCHNQEHSPNFHYQAWLPMVNHSIKAPIAKASEPIKLDKADVELYVMSQCPFGVRAENALIPVVKKFSDSLNFHLRFIATDVEEKLKAEAAAKATTSATSVASTDTTTAQTAEAKPEGKPLPKAEASGAPGCQANFELDPNAKFQSLHGQPEVDENIRQLLVQHFYPDKFLEFLLERNKNLYGDFQALARQFGMDPAKIEEGLKNGLGDRLHRENIIPGNQREISASPTMLINNATYSMPFEPVPLEYQLCQSLTNPPEFCKNIPACAADTHCRKPGFDAKCIDPGTPKARCEFNQPVPVAITVVEDPDCTVCETGPFLRQLYQLYETVDARVVSKNSPEGQDLLKRTKTDRLPLYTFGNNDFLKSPRTANLQRYLAFGDGLYFINPLLSELSIMLKPSQKGSVKLFTSALGQGLALQKELFRVTENLKQAGKKVDFEIVPIVAQARDQSPQSLPNDQRYLIQVNTGSAIQPVYVESTYGSREIVESMQQHCLKKIATQRQYQTYMQSFADQVLAGMQNITSQEQLKAYLDSVRIEEVRKTAYSEALVGKELQDRIAACQADANQAPAWLVQSLIDTINHRIIASPTVLVNGRILVRGAPDALLNVLPELLTE